MIKTVVKVKLNLQRISAATASKKKRVLFKTGGYSLRSYQRSMRYRKGPSAPGQPPSAHKTGSNGPLLRKVSNFDVDLQAESVVIGPKKFKGVSHPSGMPVPELLDKGGPVKAELEGKPVIAQVAPRPFVAPLFTDGGERFRELIEKESL